jgi:tRNA U34 5-methylaminomethyl-2-thiouridine-forming methyltransferase MnmC
MTNEGLKLSSSSNARDFLLGSLRCRLLQTADGSYSLCYGESEDQMTEPMHSSKGAWSETLNIYEPALLRSLTLMPCRTDHWCIASIGLGLGYNEILTAGLALKNQRPIGGQTILSFESRSELRESFQRYFTPSQRHDVQSELSEVYKNIVALVAKHLMIDEAALDQSLCELIEKQRLLLNGPVQLDVSARHPKIHACICILFDAFSPASSPDLWSEDLLSNLTDTLPDKTCVFASYASRTVLKKILKQKGFKLEKRSGFAGKRESTFAVRK